MATSTITSKGQITLPKVIREALGVGPGDQVQFVQQPDGQVTVRARTVDARTLRGFLRDAVRPRGLVLTIEAINEGIGRGAVAGAAVRPSPRGRRAGR